MSEYQREIEDLIADLVAATKDVTTDNTRLERENELLRARIDELAPPITDDERDLARDREREADFARSEEKLDRGARER